MEISRQELTELVATRFVNRGASVGVTFKGGRHDDDPDLQPDKEEVEGLTPAILDRMHRFTRLWRQLDWSMAELDQILWHIHGRADSDLETDEATLAAIVQLRALQRRLKLTVPELCSLFDQLSTYEDPSFFDRLFNQPSFARSDSDLWGTAADIVDFQHPAYRTGSSDPGGVQIQHRLLAGLGLNDDELFQLIEHLRRPLAAATNGTITLNLNRLTILYRHARLSQALKLAMPELFALIRMAPEIEAGHLENLADLQTLVDLAAWQKKSGYSIHELAVILGDAFAAIEDRPSPAEIRQMITDQIHTDQSLIFADTVFSTFEGITEEQSRAIIAANDSLITQADIRTYQVAPDIDSATVSLEIPLDIQRALPSVLENQLIEAIRDIIATYRQPRDSAADSVERVLDISDRILVGTVGLTLAQSRAILAANPTIFVPVENPNLYWLSAAFDPRGSDPAGTVTIPPGIPLREDVARGFLLQFHAPEVIAHQLGSLLSQPVDKVKTLIWMAGHALASASWGQTLTRLLHEQENLRSLETLIEELQKLKIWFKDSLFDADTLRTIKGHSGAINSIFHIPTRDYRRPSLAQIKQIVALKHLLESTQGDLRWKFIVLQSFDYDGSGSFEDTYLGRLADMLGAERGLINALNQAIDFPTPTDPASGRPVNRALDALEKLKSCIELAQFLGVGGEALPLLGAADYDELDQAVALIITAIRTKYDTEELFLEKIEPFEDKIRERKRDALTEYLIYSFRADRPADERMFQSANDLYHYFLIDTELEGCARTSKVVAGISSLQLYIQRCLMNLEQSQDGSVHVLPENIPSHEWAWRKNYRVWEANRKVFLWPENYIEPDLRDNKTPLFEELEAELLQQEINAQTVLDAYAKYMKGFEEIARLKIAGAYHDRSGSADVLHLFGVTPGDTKEYYYRTVENIYKAEEPDSSRGVVWNPWRKVNLQIPVPKVSPIIYQGKLYVFWVEITTRPKNGPVGGSTSFVGYQHTMSVNFSYLRLDGAWTVPQKISFGEDRKFPNGVDVVNDLLFDRSELNQFGTRVSSPGPDEVLPTGISRVDVLKAYWVKLLELLREIPDLRGGATTVQVIVQGEDDEKAFSNDFSFRSNDTRKPFIPDKGSGIHAEPKDGYTLEGYRWDRVYPTENQHGALVVSGKDFNLNAILDLYTLKPTSIFNTRVGSREEKTPNNKRLYLSDKQLNFGYPKYIQQSTKYAQAYQVLDSQWRTSNFESGSNLLTLRNRVPLESLIIINGALTDAVLNVYGDLLYLYSLESSDVPYAIKRIGTTHSETIAQRLFEYGIDGLLNIDFQKDHLQEPVLPVETRQVRQNLELIVGKKLDTKGPLGVYYREIFFHIPFLIANHLNSQGKYADAQRWYHYIFDPTSNNIPSAELDSITDPEERKKRAADRVWQYIEFRDHTLAKLRAQLDDEEAIEAYKKDPFNPHAIARLRLGAYMKSVIMKYIDNLLDWGDHLFAQDTRESINEATLLYVMAQEILGPRPVDIGDCPENPDEDQTFDRVYDRMNEAGRADLSAEIESLAPGRSYDLGPGSETSDFVATSDLIRVAMHAASHSASGASFMPFYRIDIDLGDGTGFTVGSEVLGDDLVDPHFKGPDWKKNHPGITAASLPSFGTSLLKQARVFCIPRNQELLSYWDRVEDRLYKIRNCMNISGLRRQLALFAPEIDPRLLVRARAAGLSLEDVLDSTSGNLPPYRFSFLIVKAKEYAGALQAFGGALLGALEKKDAEDLARMRLVHQNNILKLTTKLRDQEIQAAEASLEGVLRRQSTITARRDYYQSLIATGLNTEEHLQLGLKVLGHLLQGKAISFGVLGGALAIAPSILGFSFSTPTKGTSKNLLAWANVFSFLSQVSMIGSDLARIQANFARREQGWKFSLQQAENELHEIEKQIEAAEIRRDISRDSRDIHEETLEQLQETYDFYQDKFTNLGLYTWLSTYLQRLYRQAYQNAMTMARLAERAYRFERNDDTTPLLDGSYWDASRAGLLAGERLMNALRDMELLWMETHERSMEIDQAFSLTQIDPGALLKLKAEGACSFMLPELYFDLFYPGQYRRRIKSARLTIPCITGPYTNVSATLSLTGSQMRKDPELAPEKLLDVPPTRSVTIATSMAQNDSGVFRLDFRDERYMPFEGAGAVNSEWTLSLPKTFRPFDYSTINDVILHVSYTADYDVSFRTPIETQSATVIGELETYLRSNSIPRVYSLRQEFSRTFHRLLHSPAGETIPLEITEKHFPLFLLGRSLEITSAKLVIEIDEAQMVDDSGDPLPNDLNITIQGNADSITAAIFNPDDAFGMPSQIIHTDSGTPIFRPFQPTSEPLTINLTVNSAGNFTPTTPAPSDPAAIDDHKLKDVYLYLEYRINP